MRRALLLGVMGVLLAGIAALDAPAVEVQTLSGVIEGELGGLREQGGQLYVRIGGRSVKADEIKSVDFGHRPSDRQSLHDPGRLPEL